MKKINDMTKKQLLRFLRRRCPGAMNDNMRIDLDFEQLARTERTTMEVFETESTDGVNDVYDFIVVNGGLPVIETIRDGLRSTTVSSTPDFITPNKHYDGVPFLIILNARTK